MVLSGKDYTKISNKKMKGTQKGQRYDLPHLVSLYSVEKKYFFSVKKSIRLVIFFL